MEPVNEDFMVGPDMGGQSSIELSVNSRLDQNSSILSHCVVLVGFIISREACINDDHQSLIVGVEGISKAFKIWEIHSVHSEVGVVLHVRDVQVDSLQRHVKVSIGLDHIFHLGLGIVLPRGLLPPERPEWWQVRLSNYVLVELDDFFG